MERLTALISCLLLIVGAATAQSVQTPFSERLLPQWLTGIIAVTGFLFLVFVSFLVKKAWCEKSNRGKTLVASVAENEFVMTNDKRDTVLDMVRSKENMNAYNNLVIHSADDKVTKM